MKPIPLLVPMMPALDDLEPYLRRIDAARWYTNFGPLVQELEARLSTHLQLAADSAVVTTANATLALELALASLDLPAGARVLVPALTFAASATAIVRAGLTPVFCDVDEHSWQLTPDLALRALPAHAPAAVMPVATYGRAQEPAGWVNFTARTGLPVVIDAAGAFGNQQTATGLTVVFSLHATKVLSAGEGGVIVADAPMAARMRRATNFGIDPVDGIVGRIGTNAKLSEYHAAAGLASLDRWDDTWHQRVRLHGQYLQVLAQVLGDRITLQDRPAGGIYSILPLLVDRRVSAEVVATRLAEDGIDSRQWYIPSLERHTAFAEFPVAGPLHVTNRLNQHLLALPFHLHLTDDDVNRVCAALAHAQRPDA